MVLVDSLDDDNNASHGDDIPRVFECMLDDTDNKDNDDESWILERPPEDDEDDNNTEQEGQDVCLEDISDFDDQDPIDFGKWEPYIMGIRACPIAKEICLPFCHELLLLVDKFTENPTGNFVHQMQRRKMTGNAGIYIIFDKTLTKLIKVGYAKNFWRRLDYYVSGGLHPQRFYIILNFDRIDRETNDAMEEVLGRAKQALHSSKKLHSFQVFFFEQLFVRGGDRLGCKVIFLLQMLEAGFQDKWNLAAIIEFLMFDKKVLLRWYNDAKTGSHELLDMIPKIQEAVLEDGRYATICLFCSWPSAVRGYKSKIVTTECIVGKHRWKNFILHPAVENAVTREEIFSNNYPDEDKEEGRQNFYKCADDPAKYAAWTAESEYVVKPAEVDILVTFLDTNHLIFRDDKYCKYKDLYHMLKEKYGYVYIGEMLDGQLAIFLDVTQMIAYIVNRPNCTVGDSRPFVKWAYRVRCGLGAAIMQNAVRLLQGCHVLDPNSPDDKFCNIINGVLSSMTVAFGYHLHGFNFLASSAAPAPKNLRQDTEDTDRPLDTLIALESRAITSRAKIGAEEALYQQLVVRADLENHLERFKRIVLGSVMDPECPIHQELLSHYLRDRENVGNAIRHAQTAETVYANDVILTDFVQRHAPTETQDAVAFWVRITETIEELDQVNDGTYEVLNAVTYEGLRERTKDRNRSDTTEAVTAVQFHDVGVNIVHPKQCKSGYVLVQLLPRRTRARTPAEIEALYQEFLPRHKPQGKLAGRQFWARLNEDTPELVNEDFVISGDDGFPGAFEIFNGYTYSSLKTKYNRAAKANMETYGVGRPKSGGEYIIKRGYIQLNLLPRKMGGKRKRT